MKRICALLSIILVVSILFGCTEQFVKKDSTVDTYLDIAKSHYRDGEYDVAISILEKAYEETESPRIARYLEKVMSAAATVSSDAPEGTVSSETPPSTGFVEETQAPTFSVESEESTLPTQEPSDSEPDYTRYNGSWGNGRLTLNTQGGFMEIYMRDVLGYGRKIAEMRETVPVSSISNGRLHVPFTDSWLNTGMLILAFFGNRIILDVRDVVRHPTAQYGIYEGAYTLYRDGAAAPGTDESTEGVLSGFNSDQRMLINIFLSNFSEQSFEAYPASDFSLIKFTIQHCKINIPNNILTQGNLTQISQANVDKLLRLYFNTTLQPEASATFSDESGESISYSGGFYSYETNNALDSNYLSIATYMADNGDGTYSVKFNVYHLNDASYGYSIYPYYGLSDSEARTHSELTFAYAGTAVVRPSKNTDGSAFYQLVSYSKN